MGSMLTIYMNGTPKYQLINDNSKSKLLVVHCLECGMLTECIKFFHVHFTENEDKLIISSTCFCKTFENLHTLLLYLFSHAPFKSYFLSCFFSNRFSGFH